jgi:hypothetical protein
MHYLASSALEVADFRGGSVIRERAGLGGGDQVPGRALPRPHAP